VSLHLRRALTAAAAVLLIGCGGGDNPLGNPPDVSNPPVVSGQKLSFIYFQKCINPIFLAELQSNQGGVISTNTCATGGCHGDSTGNGGALRLSESPPSVVDLSNPANTPDVIRAEKMYKNFVSSQGSTVIGAPAQSRLLTKPLTLNVLHGGGVIFASQDDPNAKLISYWISRPMPQGQDEFGAAANSMFTPPDPATGACNSQ
jgi:hypothetical protein